MVAVEVLESGDSIATMRIIIRDIPTLSRITRSLKGTIILY